MTYEAYENSVHDGEPVELFEFSVAGNAYRYTSLDEDYESFSTIFHATPIRRSAVEQSTDNDANITIRVPRDNAFAQFYRVIVPSSRATLVVYREHRNDTDSERIVYWKGRVRSVTWERSEAVITCEPMNAALKRVGLRRGFGSQCSFVLFDTATCGVQRASYAVNVNVATLTGGTTTRLSSSAFGAYPNGYFLGGYLERNLVDRRMVTRHVGNDVDVLIPFEVMDAGDDLIIYPGCKHTLTDCVNKYNNRDNYGGFPFVPDRNPFESGV